MTQGWPKGMTVASAFAQKLRKIDDHSMTANESSIRSVFSKPK